MLVPDYYGEFKCIGSECSDSCCLKWNVFVDRDVFHRLKSNRHPMLAPLVKEYVKRTPHEGALAGRRFGKIALDGQGRCRFLDENRLCQIQKTVGEDWMPAICRTYPRAAVKVGGAMEAHLHLSCPEVARIALSRRDPVQFIQVAEDANIAAAEISEIELGTGPLSRALGDIRAICIGILQCRTYTLDARMLLLGEFLAGLNQAIGLKSKEMIDELCGGVVVYLTGERDYTPAAARYAANIETKMLLLGKALISLFNEREVPRLFSLLLGGGMEGLGMRGDIGVDAMVDGYAQAYARAGRAYLAANAHVLENYAVNHAVRDLFPLCFLPDTNVMRAYQRLVLYYGMIKLVAVGMAAHPSGAEEKDLIALIQSFSRWADHSVPSIEKMLAAIDAAGGGEFATLATILSE